MSYSLVLKEQDVGVTKDIGDNVFLRDLSDEYKIFVFYYPSAIRNEGLEEGLRGLGELTGSNLFVNIGKLNDPALSKIVKAFDIRTFPAIVVTSTADLGGDAEDHVNVFVRLDDERLLSDAERTTELLAEIYGLFLRGDIAAAVSKARRTERTEIIRAVATKLASGLRHIGGFVADRDIKVSLVEGSFELTRSSG